MSQRSFKTPITLAVVMIVLLLVLTVGWVIVTVSGAIHSGEEAVYWVLLPVGTTSFLAILLGTIAYLVIAIKTININRQQSNFISSVTHELKSPIASLKLTLQTLKNHEVPADKKAQFVEIMLENVERLNHLVTQILDAGSLDAGKSLGRMETLRLDQLIRDIALESVDSHHRSRDILFLELEECELNVSREEFGIVIRNLLDNAIKYTSALNEAAEIRMTLKKNVSAKNLVLDIWDNGPGIPYSQRKNIFRRFTRLEEKDTPSQPGTGLGLYTVELLLHRRKGTIVLLDTDEQSDTGAYFRITLPE